MFPLLVLLVAAQRLWELQIAASNVAHLKRRGAREHGRAHYPFMVALHALWFPAMLSEWWHGQGLLSGRWLILGWLMVTVGQALRWWTIRTLGRRWTTRVLVLPGAPLVSQGPFQFFRHPNYVGVCLEMFGLPLAGGCWRAALCFSVLNLFLLKHRRAVEEKALEDSQIEHG